MAKNTNKQIYGASDVADYFIYLASRAVVGDNKEKEGITNLKLQKILYFAQAYFLAKIGRPLFSDTIEAWEYGPVVPSIYHKFKGKVSQPIFSDQDVNSISLEDKENLVKIWEAFGGYSANRLVSITHAHSPWKEAFETKSKEITQKAMREYYTPLLNN